MRIFGASVAFERQVNGGFGTRKAPGWFSRRATMAPLVEDDTFGDCVQRAFVEVKARVCKDLTIPQHSELK